MNPYSIACSTCGARLKVRDPRAIGELSLCPKCGSMVMITPPTPSGSDSSIAPRGMSDSSQQIIVKRPAASRASDFEDAAALFADTVDDLSPSVSLSAKPTGDRASGVSPRPDATPVAKQPENKPAPPAAAHDASPKQPAANGASSAAPESIASKSAVRKVLVKKPSPPATDVPKKSTPADNGIDLAAIAAPTSVPPAPPPIAPPTESMSSIELDPLLGRATTASPLARSGAGLEQTFDLLPTPPVETFASLPTEPPSPAHAGLAGMPPPVVDDRPWASPTQQLLRRYALLGGAVVAAVVVVGVLLTIVLRHSTQPVTAAVDGDPQTAGGDPTPNTVDPSAPPATVTPSTTDPSPSADPPPATVEQPRAEEPPGEDEIIPPAEEPPEIPPADDGDAPPLFTDDGSAALPDSGSGDPAGEAVVDSGLGDLAPLIDAFPIPAGPARDPADGDPAPALDDEPEAIAKRPRPEPLAVDIVARLADPIDGIDTGGAPLVKFLDLISQLSTIPITLPPESLAQVQATANSPVSLVLRDANVEKVLQAGLAELGLKFEIHDEQLVIVPAPKRGTGPLTVGLVVEDLARDAASLDALATQIRTFVTPDAWATAGGESKIDTSKGKLDIFAPLQVPFRR